MRLEVFTGVKVQIIFWVMALCCLVPHYRCCNPGNHISTLQCMIPISMDSHFLNILKCNYHFFIIICVTVIQITLTKKVRNRFFVMYLYTKFYNGSFIIVTKLRGSYTLCASAMLCSILQRNDHNRSLILFKNFHHAEFKSCTLNGPKKFYPVVFNMLWQFVLNFFNLQKGFLVRNNCCIW